MLFISKYGHIDNHRVTIKTFTFLEHGKMDKVNGIVVHQTDGKTAQSTFESYANKGAKGAHFLIDKDGTIYQTASLYQRTYHVGKMQSRCVVTKICTPTEFKAASKLLNQPLKLTRHETAKDFPSRYPSNDDSIGIELVGKSYKIEGKPVYENVTDEQNSSLKWLINELTSTLNVTMSEIYKHPQIGRKTETEASTAKW